MGRVSVLPAGERSVVGSMDCGLGRIDRVFISCRRVCSGYRCCVFSLFVYLYTMEDVIAVWKTATAVRERIACSQVSTVSEGIDNSASDRNSWC